MDIQAMVEEAVKLAIAKALGLGANPGPTPWTSGQVVMVRTRDAGVHVGTLVSYSGREVRLRNAHRIWRWRGANTLSELSQKGASQEYTRIAEPVPEITLLEGAEIIPCSQIAAINLTTPRWGS